VDCTINMMDSCAFLVEALLKKRSLDPELVWVVLRPVLKLLLWLVPEHVPATETLKSLARQAQQGQAGGRKQGGATAEDWWLIVVPVYMDTVCWVGGVGCLHHQLFLECKRCIMETCAGQRTQAHLALRPSLCMSAVMSAAPLTSLPPSFTLISLGALLAAVLPGWSALRLDDMAVHGKAPCGRHRDRPSQLT
jgi:hypothetical protein